MDAIMLCRLCLQFQDTVSDFLLLNENKPLVELIFQLLEIEIKPHISEDYYLCFDCHNVLQNFNEFKTKCYKNDIEFRSRYQEHEQEPELKIEIEDSVIQSEIHSSIQQTLQEETVIASEIIADDNVESSSTAKDAEINKTQNNKTQKKSRKITERERQQIPCPVCGKLVSRAGYKVHVSIHDVSERFKCQICDRSYTQKGNLKVHLNTHTKEVMFPCKEENCGKVFNLAAALRSHHKTMHTDIRDHICEICGLGFKIPSGLRSHLRKHSTEKKHACAECGRLFKTKREVRKHSKVHTRVMPRVMSTLETCV